MNRYQICIASVRPVLKENQHTWLSLKYWGLILFFEYLAQDGGGAAGGGGRRVGRKSVADITFSSVFGRYEDI